MDAFLSVLKKHNLENSDSLSRDTLTTLQVNMGNLCNQNCEHCHVEASPNGKNVMSKAVIDNILSFLARYNMRTLDITGGAPEMNPNFEYFVKQARPLVEELIVRSNLTVLLERGKEHLPEFYKNNNVHVVCSLPCYLEQNVDSQRGSQVFKKSVEALKKLNQLGFATEDGAWLDLVYNPVGASLPPNQDSLEKDYKKVLKDEYDIHFNRLITITNVPIKRFKTYLESRGEYDQYCKLLKDNFNPDVLETLMCRTFLSVGFDGKVYDCDFNQALGLALKDEKGSFLTIDKIDPEALKGRDIILGEHCLSCTAGSGSSCQGALVSNEKNILSEDTKEAVKDYYGKTLSGTKDLKTSACCPLDSTPKHHREYLRRIESEILERFYGCGSPLPPSLKGCTVLDLGCGTGRDVYLASQLVGETGKVIGVDMTDEQLEVARKYEDIQMRKFNFKRKNVEFKKGYIENLKEIGIKDNSVDVVISNCVVNLSVDKKAVFAEIFRILKPGGELYFADVFAGRRIPEDIKNDPIFYGECLGGALYIEDFKRMLREVGCPDYRIVSKRKLTLENPEMQEKAGMIDFYSMTVRAFKLPSLEDICEDYGQVATYKGTMPENSNLFLLDDHHNFIAKKPMLVCGNTASMLGETRYAKHFTIAGDRTVHYGPFACGSSHGALEEGSAGACC